MYTYRHTKHVVCTHTGFPATCNIYTEQTPKHVAYTQARFTRTRKTRLFRSICPILKAFGAMTLQVQYCRYYIQSVSYKQGAFNLVHYQFLLGVLVLMVFLSLCEHYVQVREHQLLFNLSTSCTGLWRSCANISILHRSLWHLTYCLSMSGLYTSPLLCQHLVQEYCASISIIL